MKKYSVNSDALHRTRCAAAVAAVVAIMASPATFAQQASPAEAAAPAQVVVVSGTRQSIASAIERKKGASTVSDSIVAEDIGEFPDKNVGEALSRITGVQLSRDFGEGTQVAIRGVEPNLNRVELNGMSVLSSNGTAGRGAELRELPAELIKSIDVIKGVTADMTEGGVGGSVIIKTNKPLDFKKFTVGANLSGEQSSSRGGVQPRATFFIADRLLNGKLGVMANVVYDKVLTRNDYVRNSSWRFLRDWDMAAEKTVTSLNPAAAAVTTKAGCSALTGAALTACQRQWFDYSPATPRYGVWTRDHKRSSGEFTAQYKLNNELNVWASYQKNKQDQMLNDRNYVGDFGAGTRLSNAGTAPLYNANGTVATAGTCVPIAAEGTPPGMVVTNHHVTQFTVGSCINVAGQGGHMAFNTSARDFNLRVDSDYKSAGFNFRRDALDVEALFVKSKANYANDTNNVILRQNAPGLVVKLDAQGYPHFTFPAAWDTEKSTSYTQVGLEYRPTETDSSEDQAKIDLTYRLSTPFLTKVYFGGQVRKATQLQYNGGGYLQSDRGTASTADDINVKTANVTHTITWDPLYTGTGQRPNDAQSFLNSNNISSYVPAAQMAALIDKVRTRSPGTFLGGYDGLSGFPSNWLAPSYAAAAPFYDTSNFNHNLVRNSIGTDGKIYPQIPAFNASERIRSTYLRLDFEQPLFGIDIDGNFGVRYTHTRTNATGLFVDRIREAVNTDRIRANSVRTTDKTYHDLLPSFNAAAWLMPDKLVARLGWGKVMSRPAIDQLTPSANCIKNSGLPQFNGDGFDDCTAGNPNLEPYRATNKDLSLEYYPAPGQALSLAYFRKDIDNYMQLAQLVKSVNLFGDGALWDVTQPLNSQGATTKGFELTARTPLDFLPGVLGGFGVDANYTRMSYSYAAGKELVNALDGSALSYPGMSKDSYNLGLWYDQGKVNARLAYNYRSGFYTGGNDASTGNPIFGEETGFLDAKFTYRINDHVSLTIEGKNLTDEAQVLTAGGPSRINELAWSGRRYFVGISVKN